MPAFESLTYDSVRHKSSHNSYERDEIPIVDQLEKLDRKPHNGRCQGLELDLQQSPRNWEWSVAHVGGYMGFHDLQFSSYLRLLAAWSRGKAQSRGRGHEVVTVLLDLKSTKFEDGDFPHYFDEYLRAHFPAEMIFSPGSLIKPGMTLLDSVAANGWPTLGELQGKFIFCLSGNEDRKAKYAETQPPKRLCFSDVSGLRKAPGKNYDGRRIFFNFDLSEQKIPAPGGEEISTSRRKSPIITTVEKLRKQPGVVIRGYGLNTRRSWQRAKKLGVNILSTDKVRKYSWATVGDEVFTKV